MQFFVQDKNFDVEYFDEESIAPLHDLKLACNLGIEHLDKQLFKLNAKGVIKIVKQEYVNKTIISQKLPTYDDFTNPYFTDYINNYVERHDYHKDRLLIVIKKLLQVPFKIGTTLMTFTNLDDKYDYIAGELSTDKPRWRKRTFTLKLRLYRFSLTSDDNESESESESENMGHEDSKASSVSEDDMEVVEVDTSSDQTSSITASGCGCCDECHLECEGGCGCLECECGEVYDQLNKELDINVGDVHCNDKQKEEFVVEREGSENPPTPTEGAPVQQVEETLTTTPTEGIQEQLVDL